MCKAVGAGPCGTSAYTHPAATTRRPLQSQPMSARPIHVGQDRPCRCPSDRASAIEDATLRSTAPSLERASLAQRGSSSNPNGPSLSVVVRPIVVTARPRLLAVAPKEDLRTPKKWSRNGKGGARRRRTRALQRVDRRCLTATAASVMAAGDTNGPCAIHARLGPVQGSCSASSGDWRRTATARHIIPPRELAGTGR